MIPLVEINNVAARFKVPAETIEKDYVICWILHCLSKSKLNEAFTLYGGTAIKRVYFEDHRFSEDIDLISNDTVSQDYLVNNLTNAFTIAQSDANLSLAIDPERASVHGARTVLFIRYSGYDQIIGAPKEIRMDFTMDMPAYGVRTNRKIIETYSDIKAKSGVLSVQSVNTILASKLGLLPDTTRKEPRDIYDIWFLLNRVKQFDFDFFAVRKIFKEKYAYDISLPTLVTHLRARTYKERWEDRLKKQIADLPPLETVIKEIEGHLSEWLS